MNAAGTAAGVQPADQQSDGDHEKARGTK